MSLKRCCSQTIALLTKVAATFEFLKRTQVSKGYAADASSALTRLEFEDLFSPLLSPKNPVVQYLWCAASTFRGGKLEPGAGKLFVLCRTATHGISVHAVTRF